MQPMSSVVVTGDGTRTLTLVSVVAPVYDEDRLYDTIETLVAIGDGHGVSAAQSGMIHDSQSSALQTTVTGPGGTSPVTSSDSESEGAAHSPLAQAAFLLGSSVEPSTRCI